MPQEPTSPFLFSYLLTADGRGQPLDDDAVAAWTPADGPLWVHLDITKQAAREWIERDESLPAVVVDTLLAGETRPRSVLTGDGLLIVLRGVNTNPGEDPEDMVSIRVWLEKDRVISTRRRCSSLSEQMTSTSTTGT